MEENDDVVFIEEYPSALTRFGSPLSAIQLQGDPDSSDSANGILVGDKGHLGLKSKRAKLSHYEQLQNIEQATNEVKLTSEERHDPVVSNSKFVDVQLRDDMQTLSDNQCNNEERTKKPRKRVSRSAQLLKQREKKAKTIEREIRASLNSKCEQYMFCCVSRRILNEFPEAELRTREVFSERNIGNQFVCDEERTDMKVFWHRKCIEAVEEGGDIVKKEYHVQQHVFAVVLSNHSLKELVRSKSLEDFVAMQKLSYPVTNSSILLVIYGKNLRQMHDLSIELFDNYRAQFHYAPTAHDFALYLAQITRALAKMGRTHDSTGRNRLIVDVEKGVKDASPDALVRDWWSKMLSVICRMQDGQRRAILSAFPNPFIASQKFIEMGYTDAVRELANIETEDGRRLGPVMAHRLFMILTDSTGTEIIF